MEEKLRSGGTKNRKKTSGLVKLIGVLNVYPVWPVFPVWFRGKCYTASTPSIQVSHACPWKHASLQRDTASSVPRLPCTVLCWSLSKALRAKTSEGIDRWRRWLLGGKRCFSVDMIAWSEQPMKGWSSEGKREASLYTGKETFVFLSSGWLPLVFKGNKAISGEIFARDEGTGISCVMMGESDVVRPATSKKATTSLSVTGLPPRTSSTSSSLNRCRTFLTSTTSFWFSHRGRASKRRWMCRSS